MTDIDGAKREIREAIARLIQAAERLGGPEWTLAVLASERMAVESRVQSGRSLPQIKGAS